MPHLVLVLAHLILLLLVIFNFLAVNLLLLLLLLSLSLHNQYLLDLFRGQVLVDHLLFSWKAIIFNLLLASLNFEIGLILYFLIFVFNDLFTGRNVLIIVIKLIIIHDYASFDKTLTALNLLSEFLEFFLLELESVGILFIFLLEIGDEHLLLIFVQLVNVQLHLLLLIVLLVDLVFDFIHDFFFFIIVLLVVFFVVLTFVIELLVLLLL